jgi:hypothetical protein
MQNAKGERTMDKTNLLKRIALGGTLAAGLLSAGLATAANNPTNPTPGTSTGDLTVTIQIPGVVFVTGLSDITLPYVVGGGDISDSDDFCIWSSTTLYGLTLTSTNTTASGTFQALNTADRVDYTVEFDNSTVAAARSPMTEGTIRNAIASSGTAGCAVPNASIGIDVAEIGNLDQASENGNYLDVLVFLVSAE